MNKLILLISFFVFSLLTSITYAQTEPTPSNSGLSVVQGRPNQGNIQLLNQDELNLRLGVPEWHNSDRFGQSRRVGVIDRGFGNLARLEQIIGNDISVYSELTESDYDADVIFHGTQVLEVINSIAPRAELYACRYRDLNDFSLCIDWMIRQDVDIINHSVGVPALPLDGSSRWSLEAERASDAGILWVNSAGNFASGFFPDNFTDNNINGIHEFRGTSGVAEVLEIEALDIYTSGVVMLSWFGRDSQPANEIDLDLVIVDPQTGEIIDASRRIQNGGADSEPIEYLRVNMGRSFGIRIESIDNDLEGVEFALFVEFAEIPGGESQRSIIAPGDSPNVLTVGALQGFEVAPYSSRGPLITGSIKPNIVAPGEILLSDGTPFVGTSAAAPVVAGVAALIWDANPELTNREVIDFIRSNIQGMGGYNVIHGWGRLSLPLYIHETGRNSDFSSVNQDDPESASSGTNEVLFSDSFDDNRYDWETAVDGNLIADVTNSGLQIEYGGSPDFEYWVVAPDIQNWPNTPVFNSSYVMEFDVIDINSTTNQHGFAILFDVNERYLPFKRMFINNDGTWELFQWTGERQLLDSGIHDFDFNKFRSSNRTRIQLRVTNSSYEVVIDNQLIARTQNAGTISGTIGVGIVNKSSREYNTVTAIFDNIIVRDLPSEGNSENARPVPTATPDNLPAVSNCSITVSTSAGAQTRIRPGTIFESVRTVDYNSTLTAIGQRVGEDGFIWWLLQDGSWVRSDLTDPDVECARLNVVPD